MTWSARGPPPVGPPRRRPLEQPGLAAGGRLEAQVGEGPRGRDAAARRALEEAALQQVGLVDVLDRVLLLADSDGQRRETDRAALELQADRVEDLAVEAVEAQVVVPERLAGGRGGAQGPRRRDAGPRGRRPPRRRRPSRGRRRSRARA